eukprot:3329707-Prymnesium_polylepis.1
MDAFTAAPVSNKATLEGSGSWSQHQGNCQRNEGHAMVSSVVRVDARTHVCRQRCHLERSADPLHPSRRRRCVSTTDGETKEPHGREEDHRAVSPMEETRAGPHGVPDGAVRAPKQTASGTHEVRGDAPSRVFDK